MTSRNSDGSANWINNESDAFAQKYYLMDKKYQNSK